MTSYRSLTYSNILQYYNMGCIISIFKKNNNEENTSLLITNKHCFVCGKSFPNNILYNE